LRHEDYDNKEPSIGESHLGRKSKDASKVGHPELLIR
jgi:hypothetical protein